MSFVSSHFSFGWDEDREYLGCDLKFACPQNLDAFLPNTYPSWSDPKFQTAQDIFGHEEKDIHYVYSDRLYEWDPQKAKDSERIVNEKGISGKTGRWYQEYLSAYFGKEVEIVNIKSGCNVATGYPYLVFGFREKIEGDKD